MVLKDLLRWAQQSSSDALYVWRDGEVLVHWHSADRERPIETMSVTKSIVGLAIGRVMLWGPSSQATFLAEAKALGAEVTDVNQFTSTVVLKVKGSLLPTLARYPEVVFIDRYINPVPVPGW